MPKAKSNRPPIEQIDAYLDWLEALPRFDISPEEAAPVLGCTPQALRTGEAKNSRLGTLQYYPAGGCLRIGKMSVLAFCGRYPAQKWNEPKATT